MRITIKQKESVQSKPIQLQDLEPGTIVVVGGGPTGLVIMGMYDESRELVLLTHFKDGTGDWFSVPGGWDDSPITKIIGKITEIIVEPI